MLEEKEEVKRERREKEREKAVFALICSSTNFICGNCIGSLGRCTV